MPSITRYMRTEMYQCSRIILCKYEFFFSSEQSIIFFPSASVYAKKVIDWMVINEHVEVMRIHHILFVFFVFFVTISNDHLDLDECSMITNLCQYHCVNTPGSYKCICPAGFSLERGRQCLGKKRKSLIKENNIFLQRCWWMSNRHTSLSSWRCLC